jgi:cytochrome c biogenesis protein CcdA
MDTGSLGLALGAGMLAAVNPCGFALLPAYLSLFVLERGEPPAAVALRRALRATLALTAGFAAVFLAFGLVVAPVAASVQAYLPGFTVALGLVVAAAGLWVALGRNLPAVVMPQGRSRGPLAGGWLSMAGFGASYAVASLGCTIAPFLAVVVTAFRSDSLLAGMGVFLAYAIGMGLVVAVAALATALARGGITASVRRLQHVLPRLGGVVLLLAGAYVAWYGAWELRVLHGHAGADPVVAAASTVQRWLARRIDRVGVVRFTVALGVLLLAGALWTRRLQASRTSAERGDGPFRGVGWTVATLMLWAWLAIANPTTTYHLAPLVATLAWPMVARHGSSGRGPRDGFLPAAGAALGALAVLGLLAGLDDLRGPALLGSSAAVEALVTIVAGALVTLGLASRRRAHRIVRLPRSAKTRHRSPNSSPGSVAVSAPSRGQRRGRGRDATPGRASPSPPRNAPSGGPTGRPTGTG